MWNVNEQGYITNWLVTQPASIMLQKDRKIEEKNQIKYEQILRREEIDTQYNAPPEEVKLGALNNLGMPWEYYYSNNNWFVDLAYSTECPKRLESHAFTQITISQCIALEFIIWSYPALEVWINDELVYHMENAVYKPMRKGCFTKTLSPGIHNIFIRMQNISIRDTRNMFALQILKSDGVGVCLPVSEELSRLQHAERMLESIQLKGDVLLSAVDASSQLYLLIGGKKVKLTDEKYCIPQEIIRFSVCCDGKSQTLVRDFELGHRQKPAYDYVDNREEAFRKTYDLIAKKDYALRGSGIKFSIFHTLARFATNTQSERDTQFILQDLKLIEQRVDCADFLVVGLIRLIRNYKLDEKLLNTIYKTLLNFRYWMDEAGTDSMCFWSENHSLMFCSSQMLMGQMLPDSIFVRSNRLGTEQFKVGKTRCLEWLDIVETYGFEEFNSGTYTNVTVAALLNLIDFGPEDISIRAEKIMDKLISQLLDHIFDGVVISPQGRVYRDVIYPSKQACQGLLYLINPEFPSILGEATPGIMWMSNFATTKYTLPFYLVSGYKKELSKVYKSGDATITICKKKDYMLTSCESSYRETTIREKEYEEFSLAMVKEMNICYHGRTLFEPGIYGYQQHLWYGALANDCVVFVNHPGEATDDKGNRPGYWYGNGIIPAISQKDNVLGCVYCLRDSHPITFTHIHWPSYNFDLEKRSGDWLFGEKNNAYIGIWCSGSLEPYDDVLYQREYRCYDEKVAYICVCGNEEQYGSFSDFMDEVSVARIHFDQMKLCYGNDLEVIYREAEDTSQYL